MFIRPRIREPSELVSTIDPTTLRLRVAPRLTALQLPDTGIDFSVERNTAAMVVAPTLEGDGQAGIQSYLRQTGLMRGKGATVVLRIEVLASGDPGRIVVDASSGSPQVDEAAVSFARIQHWYAGRMNGTPRPMWIRWGVRFQG